MLELPETLPHIPPTPDGWGELPADTGLRLFTVLGRPKGIRDQSPGKMVAWGQTGVSVPEKRTQSSYWGDVGSLKQTPADPNTDRMEAQGGSSPWSAAGGSLAPPQ